ncbi:MAG: formylglycine-generating enzyme family protein, partial [Candidatus Cloacimonetes bacterium]|nr:formylglycine-generating enzyme family protein [Candidatus Cloacimonadota bacterium]
MEEFMKTLFILKSLALLIFISYCSLFGAVKIIVTIDEVLVKGGTFKMGSTNGDSDEKPVHSVTVSSFYIGKYEVTQAEWEAVMGYNPSSFKGDNRPVEQITWYQTIEFCNKLSQKEGLTPAYTINGTSVSCNWQANGYRLPTEAEWEFAARGGNLSKGYTYSASNNLDAVGWYDSNSGNETHDVG